MISNYRSAVATILPMPKWPLSLRIWVERMIEAFGMTKAECNSNAIQLAQAKVNGKNVMHGLLENTILLRAAHADPDAELGDAECAASCIDEALCEEARRQGLSRVLVRVPAGTVAPEGMEGVEIMTVMIRPVPPPDPEPKSNIKPDPIEEAQAKSDINLPDLEKLISQAKSEWVN